MNIKQAINDLRLLATDPSCQYNTPVAVAVEMEDKSISYKEAGSVGLKKVKVEGYDEPVYAIVYI